MIEVKFSYGIIWENLLFCCSYNPPLTEPEQHLIKSKVKTPAEMCREAWAVGTYIQQSQLREWELNPCWPEAVAAVGMVSIDVLTSRFFAYDQMYNHDLREQSFADWPFREDCNCTPEKVGGSQCYQTHHIGMSWRTSE